MNNTISVGADPEVFVTDGTNIISGVGLVGGTKYAPIPVYKGAVQEDNVLAEFNIDPARTSRDFVGNITSVMEQLRQRLHPNNIEIVASHDFTQATLMRSGRQALLFGCDPDFNAYTGEKNTPPSALQTLRTAGGHVHVGYGGEVTESRNKDIIRAMDLYLGVPSVLLDDDQRRRSMYGMAGAYRTKAYGVEYRSLSNFWLLHTDLMAWVFSQTIAAVTAGRTFNDARVADVINGGDRSGAQELIEEYGICLP